MNQCEVSCAMLGNGRDRETGETTASLGSDADEEGVTDARH
jgi:hypothetical protein